MVTIQARPQSIRMFARDKFRSYERFVNQDLIANGRLVFIRVIKPKSGQI